MMFASIQSKDIPWRAGQKVAVTSTHDAEHDYTLVMRDFHQHNAPNPILVEFREQLSDGTTWPEGIKWAAYCWLRALDLDDESDPAHIEHARRVLTRLANLTKEPA